VAALLQERGDTLVVSGLGSTTYDCNAAGDHPANFYLWGAMGGAAMVGLGLALAQPARPVWVVTGDGEQLMGLGALATVAVAKPGNLRIVVIDNAHYAETGLQKSHTAYGVDLCAVARACGIERTFETSELSGVAELRRALHAPASAPMLGVIRVKPENAPRSLPSRDAVYLKNRFRAHLEL
jgi:thiamine pyrophosphate-dependent acetolactate synthase large subunit-like protein